MSDVRWAQGDDAAIAYRVIEGKPGGIDVVYLGGQFIPFDMLEDEPTYARFVRGLAGLGRLLVFDRRGIGMSDPITDWERPVLDQWIDDTIAVLNDAGWDSAHVVGWEQGGAIARQLAHDAPERVEKLVLFHAPDTRKRFGEATGLSREEMLTSLQAVVDGEQPSGLLTRNANGGYVSSRNDDDTLADWLDRAGRRGASYSTARRIWASIFAEVSWDAPPPAIDVPALVLWRENNPILPAWVAEATAASIPGAELAIVPGVDFAPFAGDVGVLIAEITRFLTGDVVSADDDRQLVAVLFTDLVDSTSQTAALGDEQWRSILAAHDDATRRVVSRHGGRVVKSTGDGALATFPLGSSAVAAAVELRDQVRTIGQSIRQGIHVGEISRHADDDVTGINVNVAARLMGLAERDEIVVSAAIPLTLGTVGHTFAPRPSVALKGLDGSWDAFVLT